MAVKNHELDEKIVRAAKQEFLEQGFEKASLRKIAASAGVTVGAIYTRYPTKDSLFCQLAAPLVERIGGAFSQLRAVYQGEALCSMAALEKAMELETRTILHLLFDDYERALLLFCRSQGSSLEHFFDGIARKKVEETAAFFEHAGIAHPDGDVIRMLTGAQFHMYFEIVSGGDSLEDARRMMRAAAIYHTAGWAALLGDGNRED